MKKTIIKSFFSIIPVILVLGFFLNSCEIDKSLNNSPNAISEASVKTPDGIRALLVGLQVNVFDVYNRDRSRISSIWTWQMVAPPGIGRPQPVEYNNYKMNRDGPVDDFWLYSFRGVKIANDIIKYTPEVSGFGTDDEKIKNCIIAIAKTYKAILLGELAAFYGSIPVDIDVNLANEQPKFVTQAQAYAKVQELLNEALTLFANSAPINRDLNFGGNSAKWIEVVNSLKARYYLHVKDYDNALIYAGKGISSSANSLYAKFSDNAGEWSSWGQWVIDENETIRADFTFIRLLKSEPGDNRLTTYFYTPPDAEGEYVGFALPERNINNDATDKEKDWKYCARMKKYSTYAESFPLIRYEENVLISAECKAQKGDLVGAAGDVNIIRTKAGLPEVTFTNKDEAINEIIKQKHLELWLEGQTYHDFRRLGKMPFVLKYDGNNSNLRWIYPESELNANPNVPPDADALCNALLFPGYLTK